MSNKHTPEPWVISHNRYVVSKDYDYVASVGRVLNDETQLDKANASRIVACVNAMEGIEDPEKWVKDQKQYRELMANSSLSAEIIKRQQLERLHEYQINQLVNLFNELQNEKS